MARGFNLLAQFTLPKERRDTWRSLEALARRAVVAYAEARGERLGFTFERVRAGLIVRVARA